jgi:hypothetical protein
MRAHLNEEEITDVLEKKVAICLQKQVSGASSSIGSRAWWLPGRDGERGSERCIGVSAYGRIGGGGGGGRSGLDGDSGGLVGLGYAATPTRRWLGTPKRRHAHTPKRHAAGLLVVTVYAGNHILNPAPYDLRILKIAKVFGG